MVTSRHALALRSVVAAVAVVLLVPAAPVHAALPAPVLLTPEDFSTATDPIVSFTWERVPNAARYHIKVWHGDGSLLVPVDAVTVNDEYVAAVNFAGDDASWSVAAIDFDGNEGLPAENTFTTVAQAATLVAPADGATFAYPSTAPILDWESVPGKPSEPRTDQEVGAGQPPTGLVPSSWLPGQWRWMVPGTADSAHGVPAPPSSETRTFTITWPGSAPALSSPANGASIVAPDATPLSWQAVPGAARYRWEVLAPDGTTVVRSGGARATWVDDTNVLDPGTYTWHVRAEMPFGDALHPLLGPWSSSRTFVVADPAAPTPSSPADGASLSAWPVLRWSAVPGADHYSIQLALTENPDGQVGTTGPAPAYAFDGTLGSGVFGGTSAGGTRYWRVQAHTGSQPLGDWSAWRSFTVDAAGGSLGAETPATMQGPADCASAACASLDGIPLLTWSPVANASSYRVFVRWDGGSGSPDSWFDVASTGMPLKQLFVPSAGAHLAWAVLACPSGGCSETMPTTRRHFAVEIPVPALTGPANGTTQAAPSIHVTWSPVTVAAQPSALPFTPRYSVQATITPDGSPPVVSFAPFAGTAATQDAIRDGQTLTWKVRAQTPVIVSDSWASAWSGERTVTRDEPAMQLLTPTAGAGVGSSPTLSWTALPYTVPGYDVQLIRENVFAVWGWVADWKTGTGAASLRLPTLAPGNYLWRVRKAFDVNHQEELEGAWTQGTFTVSGNPEITPTSPVAGSTVRADDATLRWEPFHGATSYSVMIGTTPDVTWDNAIYRGYSDDASLPVTELLPTTDLYWRVCVVVECSGAAAFNAGTSDATLFHITAAPGADLTSPVSTAGAMTPKVDSALSSTGGIPTRFTWTASDVGTGIASQQLQVMRDSGSWQSVSVTASQRSASLSLKPSSTYTVRVRATDRAGHVGTWSSKTIKTSVYQETSTRWTWSSGWRRVSSSSASGGYTRYTTKAGAKARATVSARSIAIVSPKSSGRGAARIYVDGVKVATVKLYSSPTGARRVLFQQTWASTTTHTVTVEVVGTSGHPRVDIDALIVLR